MSTVLCREIAIRQPNNQAGHWSLGGVHWVGEVCGGCPILVDTTGVVQVRHQRAGSSTTRWAVPPGVHLLLQGCPGTSALDWRVWLEFLGSCCSLQGIVQASTRHNDSAGAVAAARQLLWVLGGGWCGEPAGLVCAACCGCGCCKPHRVVTPRNGSADCCDCMRAAACMSW